MAGGPPSADRADPVALLEEQNQARDADLVPVRHGRMMASPFTFYRGAAKIMAEDLWRTPTAGLTVQLCGDAHLSNFGVFGSPERSLVFDINDFDETLTGPFEYDVKRLAASFTIAARHRGFAKDDVRSVTRAAVAAYREAMAEFAEMKTLEVWYAHLSEADLLASVQAAITDLSGNGQGPEVLKKQEKRAKAAARKARGRDSMQALAKLAELVDGQYRIVSQPPFVVPLRDVHSIYPTFPENAGALIEQQLAAYSRTLQPGPPPAARALSSSSTSHARWSGSAASGPVPSSPCSRAATSRTRCSSSSRRRRAPCSRATCRRAATASRANGSCRASG